jgi:type IV pilus assembly protein PilA
MDTESGEITVTFNAANVGTIAANSALVLTPYIQAGGAPVDLASNFAADPPVTGSIDWGCASETNAVASGRGLPVLTAADVPLLAKFAPGECR